MFSAGKKEREKYIHARDEALTKFKPWKLPPVNRIAWLGRLQLTVKSTHSYN